MSWAEISIVFFVSHLAGDFLFQTDHQAREKWGGLGRNRVSRNALVLHVAVYTAAFVPALVWIGCQASTTLAVGLGLVIAIPHLVVDDGRLVAVYLRKVKRCAEPPPPLVSGAVDQSIHVICLWATALLAVALS